jgi:hypothetical protein
VFESVLVCVQHAIKAIALWVTDVAIEREAVARSTISWIKVEVCTKSKDRELLVCVVELQDVTHRLESLVVLVLLEISVMEGAVVLGISVTESEVDRDGQV